MSAGRPRHFQLVFAAAVTVAAFVAVAAPVYDPPSGGTSARALSPLNLGNGFLTLSKVQSVSGSAYFDTFCANQEPFAACTSPVAVIDFPPTGDMILTQEGWTPSHYLDSSKNAIVEFDPATLENVSYLHLNCNPGAPFYPGAGVTVWIPCYNGTWSHNTTLLGYDGVTAGIVANVTFPIWPFEMTVNPQTGEIYAYNQDPPGWYLDFATFDPLTLIAIGGSIPSPQYYYERGGYGSTFPFNFDPADDSLIVGGTNQSLLAVNVSTGQSQVIAELPSYAEAAAVSIGSNEILVSTFNASSVEVLNAATYATEASISISNCFNGLCAQPNDVNEIVVDPAHGDAYLVSTIATLTLNLSSLSIVGTVVGYGDGPQVTAAYSPPVDRIFGTYLTLGMNGPGFMVQLVHGWYTVVSSLIWLPTSFGILLLAVVAGTIMGVVRLQGAPVQVRSRQSKPPPPEPYLGPEENWLPFFR